MNDILYPALKVIFLPLMYSVVFFFDYLLLQTNSISFSKDDVTGPISALVISVIALYVTWKYLRGKDKEIIKLRDDIIAEKDKYIKHLEEELNKKEK